ncbi:hypothetical protein CesoFtcFv8_004343 [Champsocephalus esox]|uniref:phosphatidate cytidylyltransferase n=1 Tax=Champsocephalus esox TaxID=159716 RepID=A0AAN8CYK1_9TELE|nr:hypothetical protein CesoFtcFv8_004343 [Champsocephalus esox]
MNINTTVRLYPFQIHSIALSSFTSIMGPFGGFFASGFKRGFKIKVGISDTFVYFKTIQLSLYCLLSLVHVYYIHSSSLITCTVVCSSGILTTRSRVKVALWTGFDCQYLMATFVNVYIASFIR